MPLRARSEFSGQYAGVGFLSSLPCRALPHGWSDQLYQSSRLQVAAFYAEPLWITGLVVYGYATDKNRTSSLLEAATSRLMYQSHGPRLTWPETLTFCPLSFTSWISGGPWASERSRKSFGSGPASSHAPHANTVRERTICSCRRSCRKRWLVSTWTTQSFRTTQFCQQASSLGASIPRLLWRMPRQRAPSKDAGVLPDDPSNPPLQDFYLQLARDPSQAYRDLAGRFENRLSSFYESKGLPTLTKAERGRACTEQVRAVRAPPVPVRKARQGEVEATYFGGGVRHSHWFKQLRRMQALGQSLYKQGSSLSAREHRASLWHSIVCAPGFGCSFHSYWPTREIQLACDPVVVPDAMPALEEAQALFRSFQVNVEALERKLNKTRSQEAKARRQMNPFLIFKDLHDAPAKPVASLVTGTSSTCRRKLPSCQKRPSGSMVSSTRSSIASPINCGSTPLSRFAKGPE